MIEVLDSNYLTLCAIVTVCYQLSFFFVAAKLKFDKVTDFAGGTNFLILAVLTLILGESFFTRQILVTIGVVLWSMRISGFLLYRIIVTGEDKRFDEMRNNFWKFLGFWVFQMIWVFTGSLPIILVNANQTSFSSSKLAAQDYIGIAMFVIGLLIEFEADRAKFAFKMDKSNKGKWCNISVWAYSRHPNYFGEMLLWWGLWVIAQTTFSEVWMYVSLVGPIFTMTILSFLSGMNLSEPLYNNRWATNAGYQEYRCTTSILIPMPTSLYGILPDIIKTVFLFEFPMYRGNEKVSLTSKDDDVSYESVQTPPNEIA